MMKFVVMRKYIKDSCVCGVQVSYADCCEIVSTCKRSSVILAVCHVLRYLPEVCKVNELIQSGAIGDIVCIQHTEPVCLALIESQWWANHKSNHILDSQIIWQKDLNHYAKSRIKSHEMKSNPNHLNPNHKWNQIKSRCQPNDNSSRLYSLCAKCHQCTSGLTVNVSAKIRDGNITKINSLTQLQ